MLATDSQVRPLPSEPQLISRCFYIRVPGSAEAERAALANVTAS